MPITLLDQFNKPSPSEGTIYTSHGTDIPDVVSLISISFSYPTNRNNDKCNPIQISVKLLTTDTKPALKLSPFPISTFLMTFNKIFILLNSVSPSWFDIRWMSFFQKSFGLNNTNEETIFLVSSRNSFTKRLSAFL